MADLRIRVRGDTTVNWTTRNPILGLDEMAWDRTAKIFKIGDGVTRWDALPDVRLSPPVVLEPDGSVSLRTDNGLHKFTVKGTPEPTVLLDGEEILFNMQDLQDIITGIETDTEEMKQIKTEVETLLQSARDLKTEITAEADRAQGYIAQNEAAAQRAEQAVTAADAKVAESLKAAESALGSAQQANSVVAEVRQIAQSTTFLRSKIIPVGDFDSVTKKKALSRSELNYVLFASGPAGAKLILQPDIMLASDPGAGVYEIHNVGENDISVEAEGSGAVSSLPRVIANQALGYSISDADVTLGPSTVNFAMKGCPAIATGGRVLFFMSTTQIYKSGTVHSVTGRWTAGLSGNFTVVTKTPIPTAITNRPHIYVLEAVLPENFPGGNLTAQFVVTGNVQTWMCDAVFLDNIEGPDGTPVISGDSVATNPRPVSYTTVSPNVILFNYATRIRLTGRRPVTSADVLIATHYSSDFIDNVDNGANAAISCLGYSIKTEAGTAVTFDTDMGLKDQSQSCVVAYKAKAGTSVVGATLKPAAAITLQPEKMVQVYGLPTEPKIWHTRN